MVYWNRHTHAFLHGHHALSPLPFWLGCHFVQALAPALEANGHQVEVVHCEDIYHLRSVDARRIVERYTLA